MNKTIAVALLVVGIVLLVFGFGAADSFSSDVSEAVTGAPSNKSIWLIVPGVLAAVVGGVALVRGRS